MISGEERVHKPTSCYREFAPPLALARQLVCLWTQRIGEGASPHMHRVLPDACADAVWIGEAAPVVAGPATKAVILSLPPGALIVGARFRPGWVPSFLSLPADEIADRELPLQEFWRGDAERLRQQIAAERTAAGKLRTIETVLLRRASGAARPADALAMQAVTWLARNPGGRVHALARELEVSARQLQRRLAAATGYGPKTLQRVLRLQRLLALVSTGRGLPGLAELAAEAGYADQPHMTREMRALTGLAPATLLPGRGSTLALSDLFKTAVEDAG
jgi:AraC-like DNA-binding protein